MAIQPEDLFGSLVSQPQTLRAYPAEDGIRPGQLEALAADAEVAHLTPLSYDSADEDWGVYEDDGGTAQVNVITAASTTATDGTFTITLPAGTTAAIAHDAAAAAITSAIEALGYTGSGTDFTVADGGGGLSSNNGTATITFANDGALSGPVAISADFSGLTGNVHVLSESAAGTATDTVDGFLWSPVAAHQGLAAGETLIQVLRAGVVHAADVPTPAGVQRSNLEQALKASALRQKGIAMQGLEGVA